MKEERTANASPTKEDIKRAAVLALHTYDGTTADEWQDQADTLREGNGGDPTDNEDANLSQMIADVLREMDEELAEKMTLR
jgi:hypothetical protein